MWEEENPNPEDLDRQILPAGQTDSDAPNIIFGFRKLFYWMNANGLSALKVWEKASHVVCLSQFCLRLNFKETTKSRPYPQNLDGRKLIKKRLILF